MFAPLLVTLWLVCLVVALVWAVQLTLRTALAIERLTNQARHDPMKADGFGPRFGDERCV